jgi:hypothetical protein
MYCNAEHRIASVRRECGKDKPRKYIPKYPELHDPEYLRKALDGRTPPQVAAGLGCSDDAVRKAAHRYGITWQRRYTIPTRATPAADEVQT